LLPLGQTSSKVQFVALRTMRKKGENETRITKCNWTLISQRQIDEHSLKDWGSGIGKISFLICSSPKKKNN
jgi:hypothetical protein